MRISRKATMNLKSKMLLMILALAFSSNALAENTNNDADGSCDREGGPRDPPKILTNGSFQELEGLTSFRDVTTTTLSFDSLLDGTHRSMSQDNYKPPTKIAAIPGGETIDLSYVRDLISPETAAALIDACDKRSGWTASPQTSKGSATVMATRTSRSCPLIWPQMYLPLLDDPVYKPRIEASGLKDEIDLTWRLTQRVSQLLGVAEEYVEPFQLVRYLPGEFYKEHHDHGAYYGADTEQRPLTLLVFLSDLPSSNADDKNSNSGGYTKFRALQDGNGVSVVPRMGDGVLWKNEDEEGNLLMDAVHEAVPPEDQEGLIKYAMNVWINKKKLKEDMDVSAYRTH